MKKDSFIFMFILAVMLSFSSCDEHRTITVERLTGSSITFGASTGYANAPATKTEYSGLDENGGSIVSTSNYERIPVRGRRERPDRRLRDRGHADGQRREELRRHHPRSGERPPVGGGEGDHYFYAMYPAPGMSSNYGFTDNNPVLESNARIESAGDKATLTGVIPAAQEAILPEGGHEFKANMNYAYMYAATKVGAGQGGEVTLAFKPLVTTFEFTFLTPSDAPIAGKLTSVSLSSSSTPLAGTFVAILGEGGVEGITTRNTGGVVTVTLPGGGVELSSAYEYKVTLLTLPVEQTDLTLTLNFEGGVKRTLELKDNDTFITVGACRKVYIRNLDVPGRIETGTESMRLVIMTNSTVGRTFKIPFYSSTSRILPTTLIIDWGDGSEPETYAAGTDIRNNPVTHTYADSDDGDHTITITSKYPEDYTGARIPDFTFYTEAAQLKNMLKKLPDPILKTIMQHPAGAFSNCTNLTYICGDLFSKNPEVTNFTNTFLECRGLTELPEDLFSYCPNASFFDATFFSCTNLTSIPANLFTNNPEASSFNQTFYSCVKLTTIPEELFANNTKAKKFESTFNSCNRLTSIPENLFANCPDAADFSRTFKGCSGLTTIPERLFANNTKVTRFSGTFTGATNLTMIPESLFAVNTIATDFADVFSNCIKLKTIPKNLFSNNVLAEKFNRAFYSCTGLTAIPGSLFANNTKATDFGMAFSNCKNLKSIPKNLFKDLSEVTTFASTFSSCSALTGSIPAGLFATNTKATNFSKTFQGCVKLKAVGNIFIDNENTASTRFSGVSSLNFSSCFKNLGSSLASSGTAPDLWNYNLPANVTSTECFNGGTYTNSGDIPAAWR